MALTNKTKNNTNCSVFGCHSRKGKDGSIHFHYFPKRESGIRVKLKNKLGELEEMDRRKAWETVLSLEHGATDSLRVCSKHFKCEDYCSRGLKLKQPKLLKCAVPSQNLPNMIFQRDAEKSNTDDKCNHIVKKQEVIEEICQSDFVSCQNLPPNVSDDDSQNLYNILKEEEENVIDKLLNMNQTDTKKEEIITIIIDNH